MIVKKILFASLLFFSSYIFSQTFTLSELEKLCSANWDDFDSYAVKKKYSFYSSDKDDINEFREYSFQRTTNGKALFWVTKYIYIDGSEMVSWQTNNSSDYLKIKEQLKTSGYKFVDSQVYKGKNVNHYTKDTKALTLISGTAISNSGIETNYYEISVKKE